MLNFKTKLAAIIILIVITVSSILPALAAPVTNATDTLSTIKINQQANHTIQFTTPTGITASGVFELDFADDFDTGLIAFGDIDLDVNGSPQTLGATAAGATWGVDINSTDDIITFTAGSSGASAGQTILIKIGTNATGGVANNQIINPGTADQYDITIGGGFGDSGTISVAILDDNQVDISGVVSNTISFAISDTAISFGNLSSANSKWATTTGGETSSSVAHTLTVSTNAVNGYSATIAGLPLTSGLNTIDSISAAAAPIIGEEQFGVSFFINDDPSTTANVEADYDGTYKFKDNGTPDPIFNATAPSGTTIYDAKYVANVSPTTDAGSYETVVTYVATANF